MLTSLFRTEIEQNIYPRKSYLQGNYCNFFPCSLKLFLSYLFCFCLRTNYMLFPATLANLFQHCISVKRNALFPHKIIFSSDLSVRLDWIACKRVFTFKP